MKGETATAEFLAAPLLESARRRERNSTLEATSILPASQSKDLSFGEESSPEEEMTRVFVYEQCQIQ